MDYPTVIVDESATEDIYLPGCSYWSHDRYADPTEDDEANLQPQTATSTVEVTGPVAPSAIATATLHTCTGAPLPSTAAPPLTTTAPLPTPLIVAADPISTNSIQHLSDTNLNANSSSEDQYPVLNPELMEILGTDPASAKIYGEEIQKDLSIRLNHIATSGLSKEHRKELKDKYLIPSNCKLIKAPTLNPEIKASLIESQAKRDKGIESKQEMMACALSSLSAAITMLLSSENRNPELLKLLMDTARTLGNMQYKDSLSRRYFILSTVKKELKEQLEKTPIDEMLFGSNLSDTLKSAKIINKSGADIRADSTLKSSVQRTSKINNRPLNFKTPPVTRKPLPGGPRGPRQTFPQNQRPTTSTAQMHLSSTKQSSRQPQPRYRR